MRAARHWTAVLAGLLLLVSGLTPAPASASVLPQVTAVSPTAGPLGGGTVVTLTGSGLGSATRVSFGGVVVTAIQHVSPSTVRVTTPAGHYGSQEVWAFTSAGQYVVPTAYPRFTFVPPPIIMRVLPVSADVVRIDGLYFYPSVRVSFGGVVAPHVDVRNAGTMYVTAPKNTSGTVAVRMSSRFGFSPWVRVVAHRYVALPRISVLEPGTSGVAGGAALTVIGGNLVYVTAVHIGTVAVSFQVYGPEIFFKTPPHAAGAVPLTVTTRYGTSAPRYIEYLRAPDTSWVRSTPFDVTSGRTLALSCPSAQFCLAIDPTKSATWNGTSWGAAQVIGAGDDVSSVSCASSTFCVATGYRPSPTSPTPLAWTFDGTAWGSGVVLPAFVQDVSCPSTGECVATTSSGFIRLHAGAWSAPATVADGVLPRTLSCPTTTYCRAATRNSILTYDGSAWTASTVPQLGLIRAVSCSSTTWCVALDDSGNATTFDGTSWGTPAHLFIGYGIRVACANPSFCVARDDRGRASAFDGTNWSPATPINSSEGPSAYLADNTGLACPSTGLCVAADGLGRSFEFDGQAWTRGPQIFQAAGAPSAVSCWAPGQCRQSDDRGSVTTLDAKNWGTPVPADPVQGTRTAISCPIATFCALVAGDGTASVFDGTSWTTPQRISAVDGLRAVSCTGPTFCLALAYNGGDVFTFDGSSWSGPTTSGVTRALALSCATPTACVVGGWFATARFDGQWRTPVAVPIVATNLSCPSATLCVATGGRADANGEGAIIYRGGTWGPPVAPVTSGEFQSLSCPTTSFCMADTLSGTSVTYNGASWSEQSNALNPQSSGYARPQVSCTSPSYCVVVAGPYAAIGTT